MCVSAQPENPLALLQSLRALMKVLVDKLHDMCAEESQRESELLMHTHTHTHTDTQMGLTGPAA